MDELPNAKTILYLHGGPGDNCENFNCAAHYLSSHYNLVMIDQRGVLRSDRIKEEDPLSVQLLIDDCEYIRQQLNINQWIIIGHSYGGFLALLYAFQYPKSICKIVYENPNWSSIDSIKNVHKKTAVYLRTIKEDVLANKIDTFLNECNDFYELVQLQNKIPEKYRQQVYYNKPWSKEIVYYSSLENLTKDQWENSVIHHNRIIQDKMNYLDTLPYLKEIHCPSLLILGEHDPVVSKQFRDYFMKNAPKGKMVIIPDSGHYVHTDDVNSFCNEIKDFLDET